MYVRLSYPKIQAFDSNGNLAAGYEIHTYNAGTANAATTYSDRALSVANTNPVILNSRGEADIYVGAAVKLIFTIPGGDPGVPIWTVDYVGEQQSNFVTGTAVSATVNNYGVTVIPAVTALSNNFMLVMTPDADNVDTIVSTDVTGVTGIEDLTAGGPYIGSTAGSIFYVEIDGAYEAPPSAPTAIENVAGGVVNAGNHYVKVTFVTAIGETLPSAASGVVASAGGRRIDVSNIAVSANAQVTSRNVYMTTAGGTTYYLVYTIPNNTATAYTINITDANLILNAVAPTSDSTGTADTFTWRKDAGAETPGVSITDTGVPQALIEGVTVLFSVKAGHTLGDVWEIEVMVPARVNLSGLGNYIVYKNKNGVIVPVDGGDMQAGYPAQLIMNEALNAWLLVNPATPVFSTTTVQAVRYRKTIDANYALLLGDQGYELSFTGTHTLTLLTPPEFSNHFFYVKNTGTGIITVDAGVGYLIYGGGVEGSRYLYVGPGSIFQLQTNGIDWHVMTSLGYPMLIARQDPAAAASVTFSDLVPGLRYKLAWEITLSGACTIDVQMNADGGANYIGTLGYFVSTDSEVGAAHSTFFNCGNSDAGGFSHGELEFTTLYGDDTKVKVYGRVHTLYSGAYNLNLITGTYDGAANLSSIKLFGSVGNVTGRMWLYQIG